jgi:hypothetical protein
VSQYHPLTLTKRTSLIVYEPDIFNCSRELFIYLVVLMTRLNLSRMAPRIFIPPPCRRGAASIHERSPPSP